jgi:hypothetical protein
VIGLLGHTHYSESNAMKLRPTETELIGRWEIADGRFGVMQLARLNGCRVAISRKLPRVGEGGKLYLETRMKAVTGN